MTDDDLNDLENELRRLRPRAVSPRLLASLTADLDTAAPVAPFRSAEAGAMPIGDWIRWALPIAAAFVFGILAARFPQGVDESGTTGCPSRCGRQRGRCARPTSPCRPRRYVYGSRDEGVVILDDGTTARRLSKTMLIRSRGGIRGPMRPCGGPCRARRSG
jgi:fermentation-respiration switch protein FrsA (DUF1100 family)